MQAVVAGAHLLVGSADKVNRVRRSLPISNDAGMTTYTVLEVVRAQPGRTRLSTSELGPLAEGDVRIKIERFALTANNVTYAIAGDLLGYWDFFPAEGEWGRIPAMGWGIVVESNHPEIATGGRYYGWFPMASYIDVTAGVTADGLRDDGAHRQAHAPVYRSITRTDLDSLYEAGDDAEDRHALLRGLFLTGLLAEEFFADNGYFGADRVFVLSASSKTAIGFAQRAAIRPGVSVIGVTSMANVDFVRSVGFYDEVISYDDIDSVEATSAAVIIDMAGNSTVLAALHERLGDAIGHSMTVGMSHHDAPRTAVTAGPTPQMFFAPTEVSRRIEEWGREAYGERIRLALVEFIAGSHGWLTVERSAGPEEAQATYSAVYDGAVPPTVGRIVSLHDV
jgi:NADPH:quinone reductase-like Zn-dependent oxidoreductase